MSFLRRQETTSHPNMPHNIHQYYVYILTNHKNGTLYIGMTNNLQRRVQEHKSGKLKGFTQRYGLHILVYYEFHQYVSNAILREKQLKKWKRSWKIRLIEEQNPHWVDLAKGWF
ncbi:GIY-YIG nuclease family protein [Flagellimonas olearia]|nr:GIY-YIG nuclease family protein [Allomuricauda olearia]